MMKKITLLITLFAFSLGYAQSLPFDFSNANQLMTGDGGTQTSIVQDAGNDVLQIIGATAAWDNVQINFAENLDLSDDANNTITFRIKPVNGTGSGNHLLKFEGGVGGPANTELAFTTTGTDWQNISLDFGAGLGNYSKMVIFTDAGDTNASVSDTYLVDDIAGGTNITGPPPTVALPFDFSDPNQLMTGDGGTQTSIVQDAGNDVLQMIGATAAWDNAQINFTQNVDLSDDANNTITFRIKPVNGTGSGNHLLKFEGGVGGPANTELAFTTTGTDWQNISLDFGAGLGNYSKMVIFTDAGDANASVSDTYLVDDIAGGTNITPVVIALPFDFSDPSQLMTGGDGAVTSIVQDAGNDVLQIVGVQHAWDHAKIDFGTNVDLSNDADNTITFKIKPVNGTGNGSHLLKFEEGVGGPATTELPFTTTGTDWQDISVDFGTGLGNYGRIVIFVDSGDANANVSDTYLVDNIQGAGTSLRVDKNNLLNVSLYPNPVANELKINSDDIIENAIIYNVLGKKVIDLEINERDASINISNLNSGIYILRYSINNTFGTRKFVKQ